MAQMTPEVSKLLERALSLSVEEQEALADSLISNLGGKVDEAALAAWDDEIKKRVAELDSGGAKTVPWTEVRRRNLAKLPVLTRAVEPPSCARLERAGRPSPH
jgi:putative addiction module component (TIGR02574 family)